jgi:hypothetical protein
MVRAVREQLISWSVGWLEVVEEAPTSAPIVPWDMCGWEDYNIVINHKIS